MGHHSVKLHDVSYRYPRGATALREVAVEWPDTGVVGLLGPNGAGKSTLLGVLAGDLNPMSGSVTRPSTRMSVLPQRADWPGRFRVAELVEYAAWWRGVPRAARSGAVERAVAAVGLQDQATTRLNALSGGQHRRAMIAQAIVSEPDVLLLDEPSVGLDPRQRVTLRDTIRSIARDSLVVVATHLVEDVDAVADWVTIIDDARVRVDCSVDALRDRYPGSTNPVEQTYLASVEE